MDLNTIWYALFAVLIAGYAMLDGYDLGVGVIHLFTRDEARRRVNLNAIGPVWDGNEVWLLTGGGALFAAFPAVYATVFSGFYLALFLLLAALIARAVSLEFRGKVDHPRWKRAWDVTFALGSLLPAVLFGVATGNIVRGLTLNADRDYTGGFLGLLNPFSLLVGVLSLTLCVMHGAAYLTLKTEGEHRRSMATLLRHAWLAFALLYVGTSVAAAAVSPHLFERLAASPLMWAFTALLGVCLFAIPYLSAAGRFGAAFAASSATIGLMVGLAAAGMYPYLVPSRPFAPETSLTVYNACSSPYTLGVMLVIALIGMPLVIAYTIFIHRAFRGKVVLTPESY
ncbi:MAG: cytochrome d ubiquinol oxidase subunit II [Acidobacteria bacterium]|nr:cytochrome d ubiquinol oxidase subunit II [Acidobacteriota bacterium]